MPQERRVVTVLFADLVDSTARSGTLDPEVIRGSMARTFAEMRRILVKYGGTVEKFVGDAVMAVFGVPTAHDDDAERAVRAAFALLELARGAVGKPLELTFRIGVNTGEVVAGSGEGGEFLVTGQAVVLGARLEQAARPGTILVGPLTRRLTEGAVSYAPSLRVTAKGFGEVDASPAEALASARPAQARATSLRAPLVDRDREMRVLRDALEQVGGRRQPLLVTIFGAPGVGKSRLVSEFSTAAGVGTVLHGRCLPYGEGITYWPIHEMLGQGHAALSTVAGQLAASVRAAIEKDAPVAELSATFRQFLDITFADAPGLVVFEDVHWAEAPLLDLIENVTSRSRASLLFLCLSRPDLLERRPGWGGGRTDMVATTIDPLGPADADALVRGLLGDVGPSDALRRAVVERTDGNPLYVEEFLRMLIDANVIRGGDGRWDLPDALTLAVPPTLQGIIAARLDHLPPPLKLLLQQASVIGRTFWGAALVALGADPLRIDDDLATLAERDFVEPTPELGPHGVGGFRFRHVLVRDVAYEELAKAERIALHDACGRWLETLGPGRAGEYRDLVASHAARAFELAAQIGDPRATDLASRALELLLAAGARARRRADHGLSRSLYERAVAVADASRADRALRAEAEAFAALAQHRLDGTREALARVDHAIASAREAKARGALIALLTWRGSFMLNESVESARPLFDEAVRLGRELGDPDAEVHALLWATEVPKASGDLEGERRGLIETHERAVATGARGPLVSCLVALADNAIARGDLPAARSWLAEVVPAAAASESKLDQYKSIDVEARLALASRDVPHATEIGRQALDFIGEFGTPGAIAHACETLGDAFLAAGDVASARSVLDRGLATLGPRSLPTYRAPLEWRLARARLELGDIDGAEAAASSAVADVAASDALGHALAQSALAAVHAASGRGASRSSA